MHKFRVLEFFLSPGLSHEDQVRLLQRSDSGRPKFVGSGSHHAALYIRHSWRVNQGSSVNNILSEGPDLLGAEVVGCPTTSASSRTASTSSPIVHRRCCRLLIKFTYKPYGISLFLSRPSIGARFTINPLLVLTLVDPSPLRPNNGIKSQIYGLS
jgi:hypothetical protein